MGLGHLRAEVLLDDAGRPRDVRSSDRWADLPGGRVRALWSTPVDGWTVVDGRPRMTVGAAFWHLPDGPYRYAELRLVGLDPVLPPARADRVGPSGTGGVAGGRNRRCDEP
ncbi:DUF6544 family protein [Blastococcus sp. VKM Ac-2987]|uniref:DUF6544 family protein n=1 Tax=Blastococcus sp. VKM Ac-2987 TaxID=3004141 RepID=UPI0022AB8513|nr:DUF6544 family protein [Blastococcus sp. VKM Ac-2987]MCZ2860584.1 hypothetical protein [Blastococcus sp. VKM Ac-2987]